MKYIAKKIIIYSMVGIMQIGLGASIIEASPRHDDGDNQRYEQCDQEQGRYEHERHERERIENKRHEREMQRRQYESEREWRERQEIEKLRHENAMNEIEAGLIGFILGAMTNN